MTPTSPLPLLTIAGSDSGGAAGLQADLKTWAALGAEGYSLHGMSAITAVTAQNSVRVEAVHYLPPDFVAAQIDAVLADYGAAGIKTGFLGRVDTIEAVADRLNDWREKLQPRPVVIIDPVLVNHRGEAMFGPEVAAAYRQLLFPLADLVTPNAAEAALLGIRDDGPPAPCRATTDHGEDAPSAVRGLFLIKGLRRGDEIIDILRDGRHRIALPQPRIDTINTHGSGDTLSAAVCAFAALGNVALGNVTLGNVALGNVALGNVTLGNDWLDAVRRAQAFTHAAIRRGASRQLGAGHGPLGHSQGDG